MSGTRMIAQAVEAFGGSLMSDPSVPYHVRSTLAKISMCGSTHMGYDEWICHDCGATETVNYHCGSRCCPYCNAMRREEWMLKRRDEMLPVHYFHCVFTVPACLNVLYLQNRGGFCDALFRAAWGTLDAFGAKEDVKLGALAVLHTWGRDLSVHPHVHVICPPGGLNLKALRGKDGARGEVRWKNLPNVKDEATGGYFLFPVKAMGEFFRGRFMALLTDEMDHIPADIRRQCFEKPWVVFAKDTVTPRLADETDAEKAWTILDYLGRYVYGNAIHEGRMREVGDERVSFEYKSYKDGGATMIADLPGEEFVRRFAAHIPPKGFRKVRFYGFWSPRCREALAALQEGMNVPRVPLKRGRMSTADILRALGKDPDRKRMCKCGGVLAMYYYPGDWKVILSRMLQPGGQRDGPAPWNSAAS